MVFATETKSIRERLKVFPSMLLKHRNTQTHKMKQDGKIEHKTEMHQYNLVAVSQDLKINVDIHAYIKCVVCIFLKR